MFVRVNGIPEPLLTINPCNASGNGYKIKVIFLNGNLINESIIECSNKNASYHMFGIYFESPWSGGGALYYHKATVEDSKIKVIWTGEPTVVHTVDSNPEIYHTGNTNKYGDIYSNTLYIYTR